MTSFRPAIVITDLVMPRMDGLGLLRALQQQGADVTTLLLTAQGTVETAVEAMKEGAYDYLTKPVDIQRLKILLDKIVERLETLREVKALRRQLREHGTFGSIIGNSPEMRKIYQVIEQAAPTSASVLITGESGTGKELVAQTIHQLSPRARVSVRGDQLRGDSRDAARERDLRPRERRVHRRGRSAAGLLRAGRSRHAVSRRDRRDDAGHAGEAAARAAGAQVPAARRPHGADRSTCGSSPRPTSTRSRRSRKGKLREDLYYRLNVFCAAPAAAARAQGRPAAARAGVHQRVQRAQPEDRSPASISQAMRMLEQLRLAGQRPRAAQRDRARDDSGARSVHRAEASAADAVERAAGAARSRRWRSRPASTVEEAERRLIMMTLAAHPRQQDARRGNSRHQPEDAAQQAEQAAAAAEEDE